jgi:asparagine synthase (glutamine-hydrolysing)
MCGIFGIIEASSKFNIEKFEKALCLIEHRGPDHTGFVQSNQTLFGHVRLSIHDLNERANQPMLAKKGMLVFNGEIYNFKALRDELIRDFNVCFLSTSDTEVLLQLLQCLPIDEVIEKIEGMYAFAYLSYSDNKVFLARDLCGEKPLYIFEHETGFAFSSELKPLYSYFGKLVTNNHVKDYLDMGYCVGEKTPVKNVKKLLPDSYAIVDLKNMKVSTIQNRRLEKQFQKKKYQLPFEKATSRLTDLLFESVELMLDSDVPVCTFLSGGVDSSIITAIAAQIRNQAIESFCIGFEDPQYDESPFAQRVADKLGVGLNIHKFTGDDALELVNKLPSIFDEPICDPSVFPSILLSEFSSKKYKVALSGDGADEIFTGYGRYRLAYKRYQKYKLLNYFNLQPLLRKSLPFLEENFSARFSDYLNYGFDLEKFYNISVRKYTTTQRPLKSDDKKYCYESRASDLTDFESLSLVDIKSYMSDDVLVKVDRSTMKYGLESRAPFLSQKIVNFAINLPIEYKLNMRDSFGEKRILKAVLEDFIPKDLIYRKKQGFAAPIGRWMREELNLWCRELISRAEQIEPLFDQNALYKQFKQIEAGELRLIDGVWASLNYLNWKRHYYES